MNKVERCKNFSADLRGMTTIMQMEAYAERRTGCVRRFSEVVRRRMKAELAAGNGVAARNLQHAALRDN